MPKNNKPIAAICSSRSINYLNLDFYVNSDDYSEIVTGGAAGIDTLAEKWAKRHNLEWICYLPQYEVYGDKYAPLQRDKDMVNYSDELIAFWDGKSSCIKFTIDYALSLGRKVVLHLVEDLDVV